MRKLWAPKVKGVKNSQKKTIELLKHPESSFYVFFAIRVPM